MQTTYAHKKVHHSQQIKKAEKHKVFDQKIVSKTHESTQKKAEEHTKMIAQQQKQLEQSPTSKIVQLQLASAVLTKNTQKK